jgi:hypothetical protein
MLEMGMSGLMSHGMRLETKFLRLKTPVTMGSRFGEWRVCWLVFCPNDSQSKSRGVSGEGTLGIAGDAGEDLICGSGPDERLGMFVVHGDKFADRRFEILHTAKHVTANSFVGEFGKPALDQVDPGPVGGREVNMKVGALGEPVPDERRVMRAVIIYNEMNVPTSRNLRFDQVQELTKLDGAMAAAQLPNH